MTQSAPVSRRRHGHARSRRGLFAAAVALLGAGAAFVGQPGEAQACGGFFCSASAPVEQSGEEILFAVDGTTVTAHIRIQYQGPAEDFSWVLPLPTLPQLGVGSDEVFNMLHQQTDPRFEVQWNTSPGCGDDLWCQSEFDASGAPTAGGTRNDDGVTVVDSGSVGPFDYQVLQSEDGSALYNWLDDHGYDQPPTARALIQHYTAQGYVFVALRLQKDRDAGEIQPIVLEFDSPTLACIPLRLTSIAANPNMPVTTWVLGQARAVPMNYFHVTLNPAAYDWLGCGVNADWGWWGGLQGDCRQKYLDLVTAATDVVRGHGFVTEYAGTSDLMDGQLYTAGRYDLARLATQTSPELFLSDMLAQGFPRTSLVQEIIRTWIPKPPAADLPAECQDDSAFYTWNLQQCLQYMPSDWTFEPALFAQDLDNRIIQPLVDAQTLFDDHGYMTRMFTTQSPDEMNRDPMFSFNPQLPDVSNVHRVTATPVCHPAMPGQVQFVQLTLPDGSTRRVNGTFDGCGGFQASDASGATEADALATIQVMGESGAPTPVSLEEIDAWDQALELRLPNPNQSYIPQVEVPLSGAPTGTFGQAPQLPSEGGDCGCQVRAGDASEHGPAGALGLGAALLGLVALRRRRRD